MAINPRITKPIRETKQETPAIESTSTDSSNLSPGEFLKREAPELLGALNNIYDNFTDGIKTLNAKKTRLKKYGPFSS